MKKLWAFVISLTPVLYGACSERKPRESVRVEEETVVHNLPVVSTVMQVEYKKGDIVPHDEVCMVNNAFMGKKQIEVNHDGKQYYGCCEMCERRIPQDAGVRVAIDPVSKRKVDKAEAVIAITGDHGEVSYFESEANFKAFLE